MYLITGAAGFIGFHLSLQLLKKNHSVIGLDNINNYYDKKIKYDRLRVLKKFKKFKFFKLDLNNKKAFSKKIAKYRKNIEVIAHFAGQAGVRYSIINPSSYITNNILSYVQLLELFKNSSKVKLILYASSSSVYGNVGSAVSMSLKPQINPISVYAASKLSMELISKAYNSLYSLKFIGIRFFSVYGPWGRPDMFYYKFLKHIIKKKPIEIFNYGHHERSFTYIDDVISNLIKIIKKFKNKKTKICEVFNVGNPDSINLKRLIKIIEKKTNMIAIKRFTKKNIEEVKKTKTNITRERKIFKHEIKTSLENGMEKFISWYKSYHK